MEAEYSLETSVPICQTTLFYISEYRNLMSNLKDRKEVSPYMRTDSHSLITTALWT